MYVRSCIQVHCTTYTWSGTSGGGIWPREYNRFSNINQGKRGVLIYTKNLARRVCKHPQVRLISYMILRKTAGLKSAWTEGTSLLVGCVYRSLNSAIVNQAKGQLVADFEWHFSERCMSGISAERTWWPDVHTKHEWQLKWPNPSMRDLEKGFQMNVLTFH